MDNGQYHFAAVNANESSSLFHFPGERTDERHKNKECVLQVHARFTLPVSGPMQVVHPRAFSATHLCVRFFSWFIVIIPELRGVCILFALHGAGQSR